MTFVFEKPSVVRTTTDNLWAELLGRVGNDVCKTAVGTLPRRQADVISVDEGK